MSISIKWLVLCGMLVSLNGFSQLPFFHHFEDTIQPGYRISGRFDSIDCKIADYQSTLPSWWRPAVHRFDPTRLYQPVHQRAPIRFSAIAHIGLRYSLGSNSTQKAGISYTQSLTKNQFIQLDYERLSSSAAVRNSSYESNHFDLAHLVRKTRYASRFSLLFDGNDQSLSGGTVGDTIDERFPLIFTDVEHTSASQFRRYFQAEWANFFSFTNDSLLKTGIFLTPHYKIENRRFTETGFIDTIYGVVNKDSTQTYDHWERSEIGGTAGYFFHTPVFAINGGVKGAYWEFDNLGRFSDTSEWGVTGDLALRFSDQFELKGTGFYTFVGAAGEKQLRASLNYKHSLLDVGLTASYTDRYPQNYQRALYGNSFDYAWTNKTLISTTQAEATARLKNRYVPLTVTAGFGNYSNLPFFTDTSDASGMHWRQDTLTSLSFLYLEARADYAFGKFFFQPAVRFQQSDLDFVPSVQLFGRLGFNGYLFKAKKLHAAIGIEGGYTTSYRLMDYLPLMDTYLLPSGASRSYEAMPKLHVFAQFELGFLRWFIRVENIEQTFIETTNYEALGYPVLPLQIRLGLSWDLFN